MKRILTVVTALVMSVLVVGVALAQTDDAVDNPEPSAYITLNTSAGFALDPFLVSVNGGGEVDASTLDEACVGWVNDKPVIEATWDGEAEFFDVFFYSDFDPTLVIKLPDGSFLCNDDTNDNLLDPTVRIESPKSGTYEIWIGSFDESQIIPGLLVITGREDLNVGSFKPGALVKRGELPAIDVQPETADDMDPTAQVVTDTITADVTITDGSEPVTVPIIASGDRPAFALVPEDVDDENCSGLINPDAPDFIFDYQGSAENLRIFFESEADTTLIVAGENIIQCSDDFQSVEVGATMNPVVDIENPSGFYGVWVGHFQPGGSVEGTLTIVEGSDTEPAFLDILPPAGEGAGDTEATPEATATPSS